METGCHLFRSVVFQMQTQVSRLISETVVAIFQANGKMLEWGDAFTAPFGLTSARWQILGAIALAGQKQTAPQIAEQMGVSRQGAQKQLNLLADDGLVEKLANPFHQRSPQYRLTKKGSSLFHRVNQAWQTFATKTGKAFSAQDLETTLRSLNLISRLHGMPAQGEHDET
jgi:DNA-binding MarR family transcriptional regulator